MSLMLHHKGRTKNARQWAKIYGLDYSTLLKRLKRGMSIGQALKEPLIHRRLKFNGERLSYKDITDLTGLSHACIVYRTNTLGWSLRKAITTKKYFNY